MEKSSDGEGKRVANVRELLTRYAAGERAFSGARLSGANLLNAKLSGADLTRAFLYAADLFGADLTGANLTGAGCFSADFSSANLSFAMLCDVDLVRTDLSSANLTSANLTGARLAFSSLLRANLSGANLSGASLSGANLTGADLTDANLAGAEFTGANLTGAILERAKFDDAILSESLLLNINLSALCAADPPVRHGGPSYVDHKTLLQSVRVPNLKDFLTRTGVPNVFVEYDVDCALSLKTDTFRMLQSTYISYGSPDESFARMIYEALHSNGVTTFFFTEHATPGEKLHRMMRKGVNEHDRVILICSKRSLDRKGVLNELEEILNREARDGGASYLIPIRLDDYVFTGWKPTNADVAQAVRDRVVADFEGATEDDAKFQAGLQRLIGALRKKTVEAGDAGKG
ncbi:toll/interleukin-1 receptor domain-containing protein [Sorangium sp. So ce394]|uniref:toll/interleukin-1 receptor domain-containing protein n=1 Tax=Sorangium sp. So ce394 TaxID=3133310 RepID=UPI003F5BDEAB